MTEQEWLEHLRSAAVTRWGSSRAAELEAGLQRMAGAISRVVARSPADSTTPHQILPGAKGEAGRG